MHDRQVTGCVYVLQFVGKLRGMNRPAGEALYANIDILCQVAVGMFIWKENKAQRFGNGLVLVDYTRIPAHI